MGRVVPAEASASVVPGRLIPHPQVVFPWSVQGRRGL